MAYAKGIFDFLKRKVKPIKKIIAENFNAVPHIIQCTEQCKVYMQITWFKLKLFDLAADSGPIHSNEKRKREFNFHNTFDSF